MITRTALIFKAILIMEYLAGNPTVRTWEIDGAAEQLAFLIDNSPEGQVANNLLPGIADILGMWQITLGAR